MSCLLVKRMERKIFVENKAAYVFVSGTEEWKQKWPKKTLVYLLLSVMKHFLTSCLPSSHDSFISGYHQMKILQLLSGHPQYIMRQNHNLAAHICCATLMRDVTGLKFVLSRSFNLHGGSKTKRSAWCITSRWSTESQDRGMALQEWQAGWEDNAYSWYPQGSLLHPSTSVPDTQQSTHPSCSVVSFTLTTGQRPQLQLVLQPLSLTQCSLCCAAPQRAVQEGSWASLGWEVFV